MDGGDADTAQRPTVGDWNTALAFAFLALSTITLVQPAWAGSDLRSCYEEFRRTKTFEKWTPQCGAMDTAAWIRAALMVGDNKVAEETFGFSQYEKQCTDADDYATCLARLDTIAGWTPEEARRAAEEQVPRVSQCFRYRMEALREARAANDSQRIELLEGFNTCCAEQERAIRENIKGGNRDSSSDLCPLPVPTPRSSVKATAWTTRWRNWADYAIGRRDTAVDLFFDLLIFGLLAWVIVSPVIFIYWHFAPKKRDRFQSLHGNVVAVIQIGTFLSCVFVLSLGIRSLLIFLPASWGWYEEGEFVQARQWISFLLGTLATFFLTHIYSKAEKVREENEKQSRDADQTPT